MIIEAFYPEYTKQAGFINCTDAKNKDIFCLSGELGFGKN